MKRFTPALCVMLLAGTAAIGHAQLTPPAAARTTGPDALRLTTGIVNPANADAGVRWGATVGLGTLGDPNFRLTAGLDYWAADIDRGDLGSRAKGSIRDLGLHGDLRWHVAAVKSVVPYAVTGLGVHLVNAHIAHDASLEDALTGLNLGLDLGLGVESANPGLGWMVELRRQFVDDIDNWNLSVGATWRFDPPARVETPYPTRMADPAGVGQPGSPVRAASFTMPAPDVDAMDQELSPREIAELKARAIGVPPRGAVIAGESYADVPVMLGPGPMGASPMAPPATMSGAATGATGVTANDVDRLERLLDTLLAQNDALARRLSSLEAQRGDAIGDPVATDPGRDGRTTWSPGARVGSSEAETIASAAARRSGGVPASTVGVFGGRYATDPMPAVETPQLPAGRPHADALAIALSDWTAQCRGAVDARRTLDGYTLSFPSAYLFDPSHGHLRPEAEGCLASLASIVVGERDVQVIVDGHAVDPWGDPRNGLELARAYAASVQRSLVQMGVGVARIHARAFVGQVTSVATAFRAPDDTSHRVDIHLMTPGLH